MGQVHPPAGEPDLYNLGRFVRAQESAFQMALTEIRDGRKQSHWMWFIFPQLTGLGMSDMSRRYAITGRSEAEAYLAHPLLGRRLFEVTEAVLNLQVPSIDQVFGALDAMKLRSCATLFASVSPAASPFHRLIEKHFGGKVDQRTLQQLAAGDQ